MGDSRQSVASLQSQLDEFRERSRKDLLEAQRNSKDRLAELQRAQNTLKAQQEEVSPNIILYFSVKELLVYRYFTSFFPEILRV